MHRRFVLPDFLTRTVGADRSSLLVTTALASTLLIGSLFAPAPAAAQTTTCSGGPAPGPTPILEASADPIICVNNDDRFSNGSSPDAINLSTVGGGSYIDLHSSGLLTATGDGIDTRTMGVDSFITIDNAGDIDADGSGIVAWAYGNATGTGSNSSIDIDNAGDITSSGPVSAGAIYAVTTGNANGDHSNVGIDIDNAGDLTAERGGIVAGSLGDAFGADSNAGIDIDNWGDIDATYGIYAVTRGDATGAYSNAGIEIENWGDITSGASGILARTYGRASGVRSNTGIRIDNEGDIEAGDFGIRAQTFGANSQVTIDNDGDIIAALNDPTDPPSAADGIYAFTGGGESPIVIENQGDITVYGALVPLPPPDQAYSAGVYDGIYAVTVGTATEASPDTPAHSPIHVVNKGDITTTYGEAIDVRTYGGTAPYPVPPEMDVPYTVGRTYSPVIVINHGNIYSDDDGIEICTAGLRYTNCRGGGGSSPVLLKNYGYINAAYVPLDAVTYGPDSPITIFNYGDVVGGEEGLDAETSGDGSFIEITNHANVEAEIDGISAATSAYAQGHRSPITIFNTGDLYVGEVGIYASTGQNYESDDSPVTIYTSGEITAGLHGIYAHTDGANSPIYINNRGIIIGGEGEYSGVGMCAISDEEPFDVAGICAVTEGDDSDIKIVNYGLIAAESGLAIDTEGGATEIINKGLIAGRVDLTENDDVFDNAGTFEAREESDFGDGDDVFDNSGTLQTAEDRDVQEEVAFINLEEFSNAGLISLVDGGPGDVFRIEGPVAFNARSGSRLAVDSELGGRGSKSDVFAIDGDVNGKTAVVVNNTFLGGGTLNKAGIPVVEVTGSTGSKDFFLKGGPIDAGFFAYDLFFEPGDPSVFELRSALGQNALVLPQLVTAMQDLWHTTSDTWFDRTADLRMALYGAPLAAGVPTESKLASGYAAPGHQTIYPGLWARGSFTELDRNDSITFQSFGPATAHFNRDQRVVDFQAGVDFGKRDVLGAGDALIFGVLGGFVVSELNYDQLEQHFDLNGGQVGAYATYLKGGLFVDTLFKADIIGLDPKNTVGYGGSLDAYNLGVRVDSGYRFGGFTPGMFFEPLATIGVAHSEIDNFAQDGNRVSFDDGTSVRGRLGLRVGASFQTTQMTVEPFVIGSLWHEFEGENQATLVSSGTPFSLADSLDETWGEVSAGVNLFGPGTGISGFGKIDVTFGDDIESVGGQVGMRVKLGAGVAPFFGVGASEVETGAAAGYLPADCCANLKQRVAELEATTARKGNTKLEMTLAGTVSHAALTWDDGQNTDTYIVDNDNDGTSFELAGEVESIGGSNWSAGYLIEVGVLTAQSSEVNQIDDDAPTNTLEINESHMWVRNKHLGQVSWGEIGGSSDVDDATEMDLSETRVVAFSGVEDVGGNFFLRRSDIKGVEGLTSVVWSDLIDHLPGIDGSLFRYDTPIIRGVGGWAEYGQGDQWEIVLAYGDPATLQEAEEGEELGVATPQGGIIDGFQIAAAITYHEMNQGGFFGFGDGNVFDAGGDLPDNRNVAGSVSVLHEATGLNLTVAGGVRMYTDAVALNDETLRAPQDASFYYIKPGLLVNIFSAGHTAFYAEHGKWHDFLGRNADTEMVAGLAGLFDEEEVCASGQACLVSSSEATVWGFGVVQKIDSAEMEVFLGFRLYEAEVGLIGNGGAKVPGVALNDFVTVMSGAVIEF